jgi:gliding motility-associated-like protein
MTWVLQFSQKPVVDAGPDQWICLGGQGVTLKGDIINRQESPGPYTYHWSPAQGLVDSTKLTPIANPEQTTIYTLIVKDRSTGCSSFTTTLDPLSTTIVNVKPRPQVDAGPDRIVCARDSIPLLGKAWDAAPPYNYVWTPATGINLPNNSTPKVSPPHTYTYFLVAYSEGCPSEADSVTVQVRTMPSADAGNDFEICEGDSLRLRGLAGGDSTATYTYDWTPGRWLSDSTAQQPVAFPEEDIKYTVIATSNHGCVSLPFTVNMRLAPEPIAEVSSSTSWLCTGDSLDLFADHSWAHTEPAGASVYYTWSPHDQMTDRHLQHQRLAPESSTTYVLKATWLACSSEDSVTLSVYNRPAVDLQASAPAMCGRDSVQLLASGGNGAATFSWEPAPGLSNPTSTSPWVSPPDDQLYTLTVTEGRCSASDSILIPVYYRPKAIIDHSALRGCAPFEVSLSGREDDAQYIWQQPGSPVLNRQDILLTFDDPGTYPLRLITVGEAGCADTSAYETIEVLEARVAAFNASESLEESLSLPAEVQFMDLSEKAVSWLWDFGDGNMSEDADPLHRYTEAGQYRILLTIRDAFGCVDTAMKGPFEAFVPNWLIPNIFTPNGDGINENFGVQYDGKQPVPLQVFDRQGRMLFDGEGRLPSGWNGELPGGREAPEGTYYYSVQIEGKQLTGWVTLLR